jgi:phospholipid transport system substrate-binding protein
MMKTMNRTKRDGCTVSRSVLAAAMLCISLGALAQTPNEVIEEAVVLLDQQLTGRREELANDKKALYALIDEILLPRFDRRMAAQQVLAKNWRSATDEQKDRFMEAFYQVLLHTYADGVLEFDASRIEILEFRGDLTKRSVVAKTIVRLDDGTKVPVNYRLING